MNEKMPVLAVADWHQLRLPSLASERNRELPDRVVLQLRWLHQPQFVGYHMAKAKGTMPTPGLNVEIRPGGKG